MNRTTASAGILERLLAWVVELFANILFPSLILTLLQVGAKSPLGLIITFAFAAFYSIWFTMSDWQATPGQRLFGIRVERANGQRMDFRASTERFLAYYIPSLPMYTDRLPDETLAKLALWLVIVWFAPILGRSDRRGVHDLLCGTRVVVGK
jgi:uncharacterized RDD family membrane protein YckC